MVLWLSVQSTMFVYAGSGDAEAVRWFRLAAEQGYADAQYDLGLMYTEGRGVVEDDAEGVVWLRKAGDQGHAEAQFQLGKMFELGEGVTRDLDEATRWYRLAGEQGVVLAQYRLGKLYASADGNSVPQKQPAPRVQVSSIRKPPVQAPPKADVVISESGQFRKMLAACAFVGPPTILDGSTLSTNKMRTLADSVREYAAAMQTSLACMDSLEKQMGETLIDQQRATIDALYNNGVDQLNFITREFNKQVGAYKLRQRVPDLLNQELGL